MNRSFAVFLDDGGVMNDNTLRGPQWQRLVSEYLAPKLGGERLAWAEANRTVIELQIIHFSALSVSDDFLAWNRQEDERWLREMCELVGVQAPADFEERLNLARETFAYVIPRVRSAFPEVEVAVWTLHGQGYIAPHGLRRSINGSQRVSAGHWRAILL
jgi:hypothetical protein